MVDRAFRFTTPLRGVVLLIVLLSLADTLLISVLGRIREIGMLRAVGARRRDVLGMVVLEGLVISALGTLTGVAGWIALGTLWMRLHLRYLFGWSIGVHYPLVPLLALLGVVGLVGVVAAAYPAYRASRVPVSRSLAYEERAIRRRRAGGPPSPI